MKKAQPRERIAVAAGLCAGVAQCERVRDLTPMAMRKVRSRRALGAWLNWAARGGLDRRVLSLCPVTGEPVSTHGRMAPRIFGRFRGEVSFWCSSCRHGHTAPRELLWLEGDVEREALIVSPVPVMAAGEAASALTGDRAAGSSPP